MSAWLLSAVRPTLKLLCSGGGIVLTGFVASGQAASFTAGNVVVCRVGAVGTSPLSANGNPVFLDEFTQSGFFVQSLPLPTSVNGTNRRLVASGISPAEGGISRSVDGRFILVTGYDAAIPNPAALPGTAASDVFRVIGRVGYDGSVNTTTYLKNLGNDGSPLGAVTTDGIAFWMLSTAGGVRYVPFGPDAVSTQLNAMTSLRQMSIFQNQLYVSVGGTFKVGKVGTGLPLTTGQPITPLPGLSGSGSVWAFCFADLITTITGPDTLYLADDFFGLQKYSLVGGSWVNNGGIGNDNDDYRGLTSYINGNVVTLFAIRKGGSTASGGGELVRLVDTTGYNGAFSGSPIVLATAASATAFRGIAQAPVPPAPSLPDLVVEVTAPTNAVTGSPFDYTITARNNGGSEASDIALKFQLPTGLSFVSATQSNGFVITSSQSPNVNFSGGILRPGASATLTVRVLATTTGTYTAASGSAGIDVYQKVVESNEANNGSPTGVSTLVVLPPAPPTITEEPASQIVRSGTSVVLKVAAAGNPPPSFQWFRGLSGDLSQPVDGATGDTFTTPALTASSSYWVRATNTEGTADSITAILHVPSANASLASLSLSVGSLTPSFKALTFSYTASVKYDISSITLDVAVEDPGATVKVNGTPLNTTTTGGTPNQDPGGGDPIANSSPPTVSPPINLNVGDNPITIEVTAEDGTTTRTYTVTITRAAAMLITTQAATGLTATVAVLHGAVTPRGSALVRFEYGLTNSYGNFTDYQEVSGSSSVQVTATLGYLRSGTTYHYRLVAAQDGVLSYGNDLPFATLSDLPVALTGSPISVSGSGATLVGAVHPNGLLTQVRFIYGLTSLYGSLTPTRVIPQGASLTDVLEPISGLIPGATYHYRIIATSAAGSRQGGEVSFVATAGGAGTGLPTAIPDVTTSGTAAVTTDSADLLGSVTPNGGTTVVRFEYGMTTSYGHLTAMQGVGNGNSPVAVTLAAEGLLPGSRYHYRLVGSNSLGTVTGADAEFTTDFAPPTVVTGTADALSTTSVLVVGTVRARGADTVVYVDYGTNPLSLSNSMAATPGTVSGELTTPVSAALTSLVQGTTYYYQVRGENVGGTSVGEVASFDVGVLSGLFQQFPAAITAPERAGSITVDLTPAGSSGWRLAGEQEWRASGSSITGMTTGDRVIEYRPIPGYSQPSDETVVVVSDAAPIELSRDYTAVGTTGTGSLSVILQPEAIAMESVAESGRAQWRFYGETDAQWRNSNTTVSSLVPGDYVIECKAVANRTTPSPVTASVADGATTLVIRTYYVAEESAGTPPEVLSFDTVSTQEERPYAYVGQLTSEAGASTGFVVRPRVVATAGHVVFDDGTLAAATGLQWLFQRDRGVHEPLPQTPRGYYLMSGYAAQRATENTPGISSPQSQNLDAAALYFLEDAGRGGYSGYFASDSMVNEFVVSSALKTLVGYPVEGIAPADQGRMHATPLANVGFSSAYGQTYTTADIRSGGGNSGGPLCVQYGSGTYYPAAIYLGGSSQMVVRAIDSEVVNLFGFAEASASADVGGTGGSITATAIAAIGTPDQAELEVIIQPSAARAAGAGWRIQAQADYEASGSMIGGLEPNSYTVQFATVAGFLPPATAPLVLQGGRRTIITFTYESIAEPPVITSPGEVVGTRGQQLDYKITATNSPDGFTLLGALPMGMTFLPDSGEIKETPQEAGVFKLIVGATNAGGADTRLLTLTVRPALDPQSVTVPIQEAMSYMIASSESGNGIVYTATNLPPGLLLNGTTGRISGTPQTLGVFNVPITVSRNGAAAAAILTLRIVKPVPVFTQQPIAVKTIKYGLTTTLSVATSSTAATTYQWYEGQSGDTTHPVSGATSATFTTTPLTANTQYWVRATSADGSTDSAATTIQILPSANANLASLNINPGILAPGFNPGIRAYVATVPSSLSSINVTATKQITQAVVTINGEPYEPAEGARTVTLTTGQNVIAIGVIAADGQTRANYTITLNRTNPPTGVTGVATAVTALSAVLHGTVVPNGNGSAWFEYGRTTSYGQTTPRQAVSGMAPLPVTAALSGLSGSITYHYRIMVATGTEIFSGADMTFSSISDPPLAATGSPILTVGTAATLVGGVNPRGQPAEVYFKYGLTSAYGSVTPTQLLPGGSNVVDVFADITDLSAGATYYCRVVATSAAGTAEGDEVSFQATPGGGGGGIDAPAVTTGDSDDVTTTAAVLQGQVNPNGGASFAFFEYGTTTAYGSSTTHQGIGNGNDPANVTLSVSELVPGTLYHFRLVAENSEGTSLGADATFTTSYLAPTVDTGNAAAQTATVVRVSGTVKTNGDNATVYFDYGTDGVTFPHSIMATESPATGEDDTPVSTEIPDCAGTTNYYYRTRAVNSGGTGTGSTQLFQVNLLLGLLQEFPPEVAADDHVGEVQVNLLPTGVGGWRFVGETAWRASGAVVTGLTTGDRELEFQPVAGHIQPQRESVGVISGEPPVVLERFYYDAGAAGTGGLLVLLQPVGLSDASVPTADRAQWRLAGDDSGAWLNSGAPLAGLLPGSYLVECKAIAGRETPVPTNVVVAAGATTTATITYLTASDPAVTPPAMASFETVSTSQDQPYAFVGQLRSGTGSYSGFVVKSRVVATVAQAVFDEASLTVTGDIQWLLQQDRDHYEPEPQVPRGFYAFDDYAAQRTAEGTPGTLAAASQNLNVAALYFNEDAGRGGFSGFLASEVADNESLLSAALKTLVGYPLNGISSADLGRMHATLAADAAFALTSGQTYTTLDIQGIHGMLGGPLCVQHEGGIYYPAGIYVGGVTGSAVRSITSTVVDLFTRAASSGNGGANDTGGGITHTGFTAIGASTDPGALTVTIEPEAARIAGAKWRLSPESSYRESDTQLNGLTPNSYVLQCRTVSGFQEPAEQIIVINGGQLHEITFTYLENYTALELWRLANFGTVANTGDAADSADPDHDGQTNIAEYAAATDPNNSSDVFRIVTAAKAGAAFTVTAAGKTTRTYVLERCPSLDGVWTEIDSIGPLAEDGSIELSDAAAPTGNQFYRLRVALP